jgi:tape measure domain-containing protein
MANVNISIALQGIAQVNGSIRALQSSMTRLGTTGRMMAADLSLVSAPLAGIFAIIAGGRAVAGITRTADAFTNMSARLQVVSKNAREHTVNMKAVFDIAQETRTPLEAVGKTYQRISLSGQRLGLSLGQVAQITKTLTQSLILSGSTAEEAAGGMIQLTQAMAKGKLDGDELRSVFENMPIVVAALEKATGKTRGELYKLASQGKITAELLSGVLLEAGIDVNKEFAKMPRTVGGAATQVANAWMKMIGEANDGQTAVKGFTDAMDELVKIISDPQFRQGLGVFLGFLGNVAVNAARAFAALIRFNDESKVAVAQNQLQNLLDIRRDLLAPDEPGAKTRLLIQRLFGSPEEIGAIDEKIKEAIRSVERAQALARISSNPNNASGHGAASVALAAAAVKLKTEIAEGTDREANSRARNMKIMGLENQVLQETIDGNYEAARALQIQVAIEREAYDEKTNAIDGVRAKQVELNQILQEGAATAATLRGPYEQYKQTLVSLQAQQAAGVISAQQMGQAQVMAAATAIQPWLGVADTIGQALNTMFGESKAVAIAQAIINTLQGITAAFLLPFPLNWAQAAAVGAMGFAQVAKIQSTNVGSSDASAGKAKKGGSSKNPKKKAMGGLIPGFGGGDIVPAYLEPGEFIINKNASARNRGMLNAINSNRMASGGVVGGSSSSSWSGGGATTIVFSGITAVDEISLSRLERRLNRRGKRAEYRRHGVSS